MSTPDSKALSIFRHAIRRSITDWHDRRYGLNGALDPETDVLPLAGSREGLFLVSLIAAERARGRGITDPVIAIPNPFYQTYAAAALAAGCEPIYLAPAPDAGFQPDLAGTG